MARRRRRRRSRYCEKTNDAKNLLDDDNNAVNIHFLIRSVPQPNVPPIENLNSRNSAGRKRINCSIVPAALQVLWLNI